MRRHQGSGRAGGPGSAVIGQAMSGFVCSPHLYRYCGLLIEERPIGPRWWPLKANGEPKTQWTSPAPL